MIEIVERFDPNIRRAQNFVEAETVERAEPNTFGAFADRFHHAALHFPRGFIGECEPKNVFARKIGIGFEQMADAFGDDARLAGPRAGDDQQRAVGMFHGKALFGVEWKSAARERLRRIGGTGHRLTRIRARIVCRCA